MSVFISLYYIIMKNIIYILIFILLLCATWYIYYTYNQTPTQISHTVETRQLSQIEKLLNMDISEYKNVYIDDLKKEFADNSISAQTKYHLLPIIFSWKIISIDQDTYTKEKSLVLDTTWDISDNFETVRCVIDNRKSLDVNWLSKWSIITVKWIISWKDIYIDMKQCILHR